MPGAEDNTVISLIESLIFSLDGTKNIYDAAGNAKGLPDAFHRVAARLPLIYEILRSAKEIAHTLDKKGQEALKPSLEICKAKAKDLNHIFQEVILEDDDRWNRYTIIITALGMRGDVEWLMEGILMDTQLLVSEKLIGIATKAQPEGLKEGIFEMEGINLPFQTDHLNLNQSRSGFSFSGNAVPADVIIPGYSSGHETLVVSPVEQIKIQAPAVPKADRSGRGPVWIGASIPHKYQDLTNQIRNQGCELLNLNKTFGSVDVLFQKLRPSNLGDGSSDTNVDWVESDKGAQLMLLISFQSAVKLHTLQVRIYLSYMYRISIYRTGDSSQHYHPVTITPL
jgi:hypothetical protein